MNPLELKKLALGDFCAKLLYYMILALSDILFIIKLFADGTEKITFYY